MDTRHILASEPNCKLLNETTTAIWHKPYTIKEIRKISEGYSNKVACLFEDMAELAEQEFGTKAVLYGKCQNSIFIAYDYISMKTAQLKSVKRAGTPIKCPQEVMGIWCVEYLLDYQQIRIKSYIQNVQMDRNGRLLQFGNPTSEIIIFSPTDVRVRQKCRKGSDRTWVYADGTLKNMAKAIYDWFPGGKRYEKERVKCQNVIFGAMAHNKTLWNIIWEDIRTLPWCVLASYPIRDLEDAHSKIEILQNCLPSSVAVTNTVAQMPLSVLIRIRNVLSKLRQQDQERFCKWAESYCKAEEGTLPVKFENWIAEYYCYRMAYSRVPNNKKKYALYYIDYCKRKSLTISLTAPWGEIEKIGEREERYQSMMSELKRVSTVWVPTDGRSPIANIHLPVKNRK